MSQQPGPDEVLEISSGGVSVEKGFEAEAFPVPAIRFRLVSRQDEPVRVRLVDPIPEDFPMDGVGFHEDYDSDNWTAYKDGRVEYERTLAPGEPVETVYGVRMSSVDAIGKFLSEPTLESVERESTVTARNRSNGVELAEKMMDELVERDGAQVASDVLAGNASNIPGLEEHETEEPTIELDLPDPEADDATADGADDGALEADPDDFDDADAESILDNLAEEPDDPDAVDDVGATEDSLDFDDGETLNLDADDDESDADEPELDFDLGDDEDAVEFEDESDGRDQSEPPGDGASMDAVADAIDEVDSSSDSASGSASDATPTGGGSSATAESSGDPLSDSLGDESGGEPTEARNESPSVEPDLAPVDGSNDDGESSSLDLSFDAPDESDESSGTLDEANATSEVSLDLAEADETGADDTKADDTKADEVGAVGTETDGTAADDTETPESALAGTDGGSATGTTAPDQPTAADGVRTTGGSAAGSAAAEEGLATALAAEIREGSVPEADLQLLREELELGTSNSVDTRLQHIQTRLDDLTAYTDALEAFIDENGSARQIVDEFDRKVAAVRSDLEDVAATADENGDAITGLDREVADARADLDDVSGELDEVRAELGDVQEELSGIQAWRSQLGEMFK